LEKKLSQIQLDLELKDTEVDIYPTKALGSTGDLYTAEIY
jgi:hypothetical protein